MSFLAPLFLAGALALSIPVYLHLIHRERKDAVEFPSLMFLQRIPYRSVRRQKLRHLLLLALRCVALAFLVFAFARPFFRRNTPAASARTGAREVVVLLDRSYSMGYGDRFARAVDGARRAVRGLGAADRATLVAFDAEPEALTPPTRSVAMLDAALSKAVPGSRATRYAPALKLAGQILAGSNLPRKEVVLVTDFQRLGWTSSTLTSAREEVALPPGTVVTPVDVGSAADSAMTNVAIADVSVQRDERQDRDRALVAARLTNTGTDTVPAVAVTLALNGRDVETQRVTVSPHSSAQVRFTPLAVPAGTSAGVVRLAGIAASADRLAADDRRYFTVSPGASIAVLVLEPARARANQSLYLSRALAIGEQPSFRVDVKRGTALSAGDLEGRSLVVFDETPPPDGSAAGRLRAFVAAGGGVLVAAGDQMPDGAWTGEWSTFLPAAIGTVIDRAGDAGATLSWIDYDHPVFDVFNAPRSGDFSAVRFLRYRRLTMRGDSAGRGDSAHVRARFDDGAPALVERTIGRGHVLLWASTLDSWWSDLPLQPVFLPFVHQLTRYAARYEDTKSSYVAGDVLGVRGGIDDAARGLTVESPSGAKLHLAPGDTTSPFVPLPEQGVYEVRAEGAAPGTGRRVAVNLDPAEANIARIDPAELTAALVGSAAGATGGIVRNELTREDEERRQTIWWYLLVLAVVVLAGETIMSNRLSKNIA